MNTNVSTYAAAAAYENTSELHVPGRIGVLFGALAVGGAIGVGVGLTVGRVDFIALAGGSALVCMAALYFTLRSFFESCDLGRPLAALLIGLHMAALGLWPALVFTAPELAGPSLGVALASLGLYALFARITDTGAARLCAHGLLFAAAAGCQSLFHAMTV